LYRNIALIALPLLLIAACQNDPDSTVLAIIPNEDIVGALRFDTQRDSSQLWNDSYRAAITAPSSIMLSAGSASGYEATSLLRWLFLPDTIGQAGRILAASIRLHPLHYHIGASAQMTLELHEIASFWSSFTFTSDSLATLRSNSLPVGRLTVAPGEVDSLDIPIDTSVVRSWLQRAAEGRFTDLLGVTLRSADEGRVQAFHSAEGARPPVLEILLERDGRIDTIRGANPEDTWCVTGPEVAAADRLVIEGGTAIRGRLMFDLSSIPPASIVNHAVLHLRIDRAASTKNYRGIDSLLVHVNLDSSLNRISSVGLLTRLDGTDGVTLSAEGVLLTQAVQDWVNRRPNNGFILIKAAESSDIDRLVLYAATSPVELRPRLVVTYTSQP
jgi:hypothetical protein